MGTKTDPGRFDCHAAAHDDEPLFTLLARDPQFVPLVSLWAAVRTKNWPTAAQRFADLLRVAQDVPDREVDAAKAEEARAVAHTAVTWRTSRNLKAYDYLPKPVAPDHHWVIGDVFRWPQDQPTDERRIIAFDGELVACLRGAHLFATTRADLRDGATFVRHVTPGEPS
jgi:hypothetical protein